MSRKRCRPVPSIDLSGKERPVHWVHPGAGDFRDPLIDTFGRSRPTMTSDAHRHRPHDPTEHDHVHGDSCGHRVVSHDDHLDYLHDGHWHAPHNGHYDEHPNL